MTLHIIHSNKVERLHDELCYLLKQSPLSNPFEVETIVCPSKAMSRWAHVRFAKNMGVAAHYHYPMPSTWLWQMASHVLPNIPEHDPLQRELLTWKVFYALNDHLDIDHSDNERFDSVNYYLKNDDDATKRWSLAKKIALIFERYQLFRPDMIQQWTQGELDDWQSELWHSIRANIDTDRVELTFDLIKQLSTAHESNNIPKRVIFFSVSALPSLMFHAIQALAKQTDVYFFTLSPSEHYWSDLLTLKQQARQRLESPELTDYFTSGHELLASWGRQGQVFQDMLLNELDDSSAQQHEAYDNHFESNLLQQLQQSLFELNDETIESEVDNSLRFNHCHSPLRECEVLHDQCLGLLENDEITPEDILVIVPNIQLYAPMIEAVFKKSFDQDAEKPFIPWNLSDSSLKTQHPLNQIFLDILALPNSRFNATCILSLLDCPELLHKFKLEESDKKIIRDYITQANIHWGIDAEHKSQFNVPKMDDSTWHEAQQRFYTFYAINEIQNIDGVTPLQGFTSSRAHVIAQFMYLLDTLNHWRVKLSYARTMTQWQSDLNNCIDDLFSNNDEGAIQSIRDVIDELVIQSTPNQVSDNQIKTENISLRLLTKQLQDYFEQEVSQQRFFSGGITFCGMRPMRSVPFKVIAMLGMNENEFPRHNNPVEFDLMAKQWRPGDLLISDEDRYLFLEAILCARHTLIMSYCAYSLKDNAAQEPSNLISELRDYLDSHFIVANGSDETISTLISTDYAMHSFSANNYSEQYKSYNQFWCSVANVLSSQNETLDDKQSSSELISTLDQDIEISQLIRCIKDPVKYFFNHTLHISLFDEDEIIDDEIFSLDSLQQWIIKDQLIKSQINGHDADEKLNAIKSALPHGAHSQSALYQLISDIEAQFEGIEAYHSSNILTESINLKLTDNVHLIGQVSFYEGLGQLLITPSNFGSKPFIEAWVKHCLLCASDLLSMNETSLVVFKNKTLSFKTLSNELALNQLIDLFDVMQQSTHGVLMVLPKCSFEYQLKLKEGVEGDEGAQNEAINAALKVWLGNPKNEVSLGEKEIETVKLAFQSFYDEPSVLFADDNFQSLSNRLYSTALTYSSIEEKE